MSLLAELKRRNVIRVAGAYLVLSWLLLQIGEVTFDFLAVPDWAGKLLIAFLGIGLIPVIIFSWAYELTPEGVKRDKDVDRSQSITHHTARKLDVITIVLLIAAIGAVMLDRLVFEQMPSVAQPAPEPVLETVSPQRTVEDSSSAESASPSPRSVAVLPFTTRSAEAEDAFFADGMHDDLLTQLAKIAALKVISRTSVMEYRDTTKKIPEIAGELNVATVVEGAVQRAGTRVRITAQLIDANTDQHLWAETFDRELTAENVFEIQTEIARSIAAALQAALTPDEQEQLGRVLTDNLQAWEAYRRALRLLDGITPEEYGRARLEAQRALELDPQLAAAYSILARVHMSNYWFYGADPADREAAWNAIQNGREYSADSPELDIAEAYYHYWGYLAYDKALAALDRALKAIPNDADLYKVRGYTLRRAGRFLEAIGSLEHAHSLDPRNPVAAQTLMETYLALGQVEQARRWGEIAAEIDPEAAWLSVWRGEFALLRGDLRAAIHAFNTAGTPNASSAYRTWFAHLAAGRTDEALRISDFSGFTESNSALYPPMLIAGITHRMAGDQEQAAAALSQVRAELEPQFAANPDDHKLAKALCQASGAAGDIAAAESYCSRALETVLPDRFDLNATRLEVAQGLAMAKALESALNVLETTLDSPARPRGEYLRANPMLQNLRAEPRFDTLLARINQVEPLQ